MLQLVKNKQETCKILTETHQSNIMATYKNPAKREKINSENNAEKNDKNKNEKIDKNSYNAG